ncbi:MAG: undecaprenyl-diphosphate phosphatase [Bacteroidota bacterium]
MGILDAIILGIIQGLTEFLPVSSSGHIEIGQALLGTESLKENEQLLSVVLHAATALSTIWVFRKDIGEILNGLLKLSWNEAWQFAVKVIISMVPAAFVGFFYDDLLEALFEGQLKLVGAMLFITGGLLFLADRAKNTNKDVSFGNAVIIGLAQAVAILPGISRSGATISTSVLLGIDREKAAKFSFLMVVPLILGKMAKDILDGKFLLSEELAVPLVAGFTAAFFTGLIACLWMIQLVKQSKLSWFANYCFVVGVIAFTFG